MRPRDLRRSRAGRRTDPTVRAKGRARKAAAPSGRDGTHQRRRDFQFAALISNTEFSSGNERTTRSVVRHVSSVTESRGTAERLHEAADARHLQRERDAEQDDHEESNVMKRIEQRSTRWKRGQAGTALAWPSGEANNLLSPHAKPWQPK